MSHPADIGKSRKRHYRQRVVCGKCNKEIDSDYKDGHVKKVHNGEKVKFKTVTDANQSQISNFLNKSSKPAKRQTLEPSTAMDQQQYFARDENPSSSVPRSETPSVWTPQELENSSQTSTVLSRALREDCDSSQSSTAPINVQDPKEDITYRHPAIISDVQDWGEDCDSSQPSSAPSNAQDPMEDISCSHSTIISDVQDQVDECASSNLSTAPTKDPNKNFSRNLTSTTSPNMSCSPNQPILKEYNRKKFGKEMSYRDFNPQWYKIYPWISFDIEKRQCVCFACAEFMGDNSFTFDNWKKSERLKKHAKSDGHKNAMTKWISSKASAKHQTSVLKQLQEAHGKDVLCNREYLRIIIECMVYTAQQNIATRGHEENRNNIGDISDINRGNFLELLHLRCNDIPWLKEKLQSQLKLHAQWTSPSIQNELLEIIASFVVERIKHDVLLSKNFALIMDETSDISHVEQVSMCLRYVLAGESKETFIGFFSTMSTEGEVLYELVKKVLREHGLKLEDIVGECFDGASNMRGKRKGVATRMKECSPRAIYVHCYGHLLNLALQDTMSEVEPLRNALGTVQSLYNFLEASPKRHAVFSDIKVDGDHIVLTLKSLSVTRWSCRWVAVRAVTEQMQKIIKALLILAKDKDPKTYTDSTALLNAICDFEFVFGLLLLKVILSNTNSLSRYLQGKSMDVITAKRNADLTIKTLRECRNEDNFELLWKRAQIFCDKIKEEIKETRFTFKDAKAPRRRPSRRLQALVGESSNAVHETSPQNHYRINTFYQCFDKVLGEMKSRFEGNDEDVLCALGDIVLNSSPLDNSFKKVADFYNLDRDLLQVEKSTYENSVSTYGDEDSNPRSRAKTVADVVYNMYTDGLNELLPVLYEAATILASIPATSCSAERSFSGLRRMKTYLRSTMGQERLNSIAVINIERAYSNTTIKNDMAKIIDTFARRHRRDVYFF